MKVYNIEKDGLPNMDNLVGKVAFIFDGNIVSGWPLRGAEDFENAPDDLWEGNSDVSFGKFSGVKHYVVFNIPVWEIDENYGNEMLAKGEIEAEHAIKCQEEGCKNAGVKDYNGHGHVVCENCYDCLNREFDEDYR